MADNTTLSPGSGGDTMRDKDRSGIKTSIIGIDLGIGTGTESLMAGAMPVTGTFWQATQPVSIAAPVPVTGTFWQATQPISGTITANAGTNLNTSLLALEAGHLATIDTKTPALGQALAAASTPVVLTALQLTALTPLSTVTANQGGTWNIGTVTTVTTVSAVTAITNALPAGTNLLGITSSPNETSTIYNGTTPLTPVFIPISVSASGATLIIPATGGKRIRVLRYSLSANGAVNAKFQTSSGTDLTGLEYMTQFARGGGAYCPVGLFQTFIGEGLNLNLSAAVAVGGVITYILV